MFRQSTHLRSALRHNLKRNYHEARLRLSTISHSPSVTSSSPSYFSSAIFFGAPVLITFSLGAWQVKRLFRKKSLIDERRQHLYGTPLNSEDLWQQHERGEDLDFHSVTLRGRFLHDQEMFVSPRAAPQHLPPAVLQWCGSSGLLVVTPCLLENKRIALVNRGWIPHRLVDKKKRRTTSVSPLPFLTDHAPVSSSKSEEILEFKGVIRNKQERNRFMPDNVPEKDEWFHIDATEMIDNCGLQSSESNPVIVELCEPLPSNGWPFPRTLGQFLEFRTPPSTHVTYAVTWFSLSFALALLMRGRLRKVSRR